MAKGKEAEISIVPPQQGSSTFLIKGVTPLIYNAMSAKAKHDLLVPTRRRTAADRAGTPKHEPFEEYRSSVYRAKDGPTRLIFPAPAFKKAMATAALDLPGTKKTEIGRLVWAEGTHVAIYGVPQLLMSVVRMADISKTPDIRTRAILPEWACMVTINYQRPKLSGVAVANLLAAAGLTVGIGDFRQEKGAGNFGQFHLVNDTDEGYKRIVADGGCAAQDAALADPTTYDNETEELLSWYKGKVIPLEIPKGDVA